MSHQTIGMISGALIIISALPFMVRTYQGKSELNPTTWCLFSAVGVIILLTFESSGAKDNIWPAVFGVVNPIMITAILWIRQRERWKKLDGAEMTCAILGVISLIIWAFVKDSPEYAQTALYTAIIADGFALIPTYRDYIKDPNSDRPFPWFLFAVAYGLSMFAISEHTWANYLLPIYMLLGGGGIAAILIRHRLKEGIPLREWI